MALESPQGKVDWAPAEVARNLFVGALRSDAVQCRETDIERNRQTTPNADRMADVLLRDRYGFWPGLVGSVAGSDRSPIS